VITAAQVNATIGVGKAILAMLQELCLKIKRRKKGLKIKRSEEGLAFGKDQDPRGSEGRNR
jgi:hypothetical protein